HVIVYAILFFLVYLGITANRQFRWQTKQAIAAVIITIAYACLDEWHQSFVPTRSGNILDVAIDALGALIAAGLLAWYEWWSRVTDQPDTNPQANFNYMGASVHIEKLPQLAAKLAEMLRGGEVIALTG